VFDERPHRGQDLRTKYRSIVTEQALEFWLARLDRVEKAAACACFGGYFVTPAVAQRLLRTAGLSP
jgi:hypothetical protein